MSKLCQHPASYSTETFNYFDPASINIHFSFLFIFIILFELVSFKKQNDGSERYP